MVRVPWEHAFPAGLIMAQVGEFSFILAAVGWKNGAISGDGYRLAIAVIAVSLLVSPLWMHSVRRFHVVANHGITSFREAMAEVYAGELAEIERGSVLVRLGLSSVRRRAEAARLAWRKRKELPGTAPADDPTAKAETDPETSKPEPAGGGVKDTAPSKPGKKRS
jgi:CPA2 family monovalent cation:H+ antiporter-2